MKALLAALILALTVAIADAASYSFNTTAAQEAVVTQAAQAAGQTNNQWMADRVREAVQSSLQMLRRARLCADPGARYDAMTRAQQLAFCDACGTASADCPQ